MAGLGDYEYQPPGSTSTEGGRDGMLRLVVLGAIVVALIAAIGFYLVRNRRSDQSSVPAQPSATAAQAPAAVTEDVEQIDLPPLDDSDALVRQRVGLLSSHPLVAKWLGTNGLVRNFVVVIDNISHGVNPSSHLRILKPAGEFQVTNRGGATVIDPRSYDRFNLIRQAAASFDAHTTGRLYLAFRPLLQTAYDELGNQEPFDRAVERAIGSLLAVPAIDGDVRVQQGEGVGYEYADDRLEALSGAQKQLLRMGPENVRIIQAQLRTFAAAIGVSASRLN
jgi:hypothetical protein